MLIQKAKESMCLKVAHHYERSGQYLHKCEQFGICTRPQQIEHLFLYNQIQTFHNKGDLLLAHPHLLVEE